MLISIVVPTYNRSAMVRDAIISLMNQSVTDDVALEAIFVVNGSTDDTEQLLREQAQRWGDRLRYFVIEGSGSPAAPRNRGIKEARGEIIILLDDDVLPENNLVQKHADYHAAFPQREAVALGIAYVPDSLARQPVSFFHEFNYEGLASNQLIPYTYFWTSNISFKRSFMLEYGMFNEDFLYNEDIICGHQLNRHGMQLRFVPEARGEHLHQMDISLLEQKGIHVGRWIWATTEQLPEPELLDRYGVLSKRLGPRRYVKRLINRGAFRLLDNPLVAQALRLLGAKSPQRSRITDLYYYLLYRRKVVEGYKQAKSLFNEYRRRGESIEPAKLVRTMS